MLDKIINLILAIWLICAFPAIIALMMDLFNRGLHRWRQLISFRGRISDVANGQSHAVERDAREAEASVISANRQALTEAEIGALPLAGRGGGHRLYTSKADSDELPNAIQQHTERRIGEAQQGQGQVKSAHVVVAEEFVLVDTKGNPRARMAMEDGINPMLALLDEDGARGNYFILTPTGPALRLGNRHGEEIMLSLGDYVGEEHLIGDQPIAWISVSDRNGFNTLIGKMGDRTEDENAGRARGVSAASIVLSGSGKVLWSTY